MALLHALLHWPPAPAGGLAPGPISRALDSVGFDLLQPLSWSSLQAGFFTLAVMGALGFLNNIVPLLFARSRSIPAQGSHLDALSPRDRAFLAFNRLASIPFSYHFVRAAWVLPSVAWLPEQLSVRNVLLPLPVLFVTYDLFYASFHRALHLQSVYKLVHKHHHRQHAPSRGATDAINVHPFEFVYGEYNHLLALLITIRLLGEVHVAAILAFIVAGGAAASLNHTRLDVSLPGGLYAVRAHDVHHRMPRKNYGQYTMFWDRIMGTYLPWTGPAAKAA